MIKKPEVSRQRKAAIVLREQGKCKICAQPAMPSTRKGSGGRGAHCLTHAVAQRERQRKRLGSQRRNRTETYRLEASPKGDK